jgi:hypothetical protein
MRCLQSEVLVGCVAHGKLGMVLASLDILAPTPWLTGRVAARAGSYSLICYDVTTFLFSFYVLSCQSQDASVFAFL